MTTTTTTRRRSGGQEGFTLAEILVTMVVGLVFAAGLSTFFLGGLHAFSTQRSQSEADINARNALLRFTQDVRQAITPDDGQSAPILSLDSTSVVLYSEVDNRAGGVTTAPRPKKVEYKLVGTQLIRSSAEPIGVSPTLSWGSYSVINPVAENVLNGSNAAFTAYDFKGLQIPLPITNPKRIATIRIRLLIGQKVGASNTTTETATDVTLRNFILR